MENRAIVDLMGTTMSKIREMVDVNTIVGHPVCTPDGTTIIPVSSVSFAFCAGGSDFESKSSKADAGKNFGGGSGAGVKMKPAAFLVVSQSGVKILPVDPQSESPVERIVEAVPSLIDKVGAMFKKKKDNEA